MSSSGEMAVVRVLPDHDAACRAAAEAIADLAVASVARSGRFTWALTGGSTAERAYRILAEAPLCERVPWDRSELFLGDERWVPDDDDRSNFRMARESLLDHLQASPLAIHPMPTHMGSPREGASAYERLLVDRLSGPARSPGPESGLSAGKPRGASAPPRFDLVLLGLGADGHVASLFPGSPALSVADRWVVAVEAPDSAAVRDRLTLTFPVLEASVNILVLATGEQKSRAVAEALERASATPAARLAGHPRGFWYLDAAAASGLRNH